VAKGRKRTRRTRSVARRKVGKNKGGSYRRHELTDEQHSVSAGSASCLLPLKTSLSFSAISAEYGVFRQNLVWMSKI